MACCERRIMPSSFRNGCDCNDSLRFAFAPLLITFGVACMWWGLNYPVGLYRGEEEKLPRIPSAEKELQLPEFAYICNHGSSINSRMRFRYFPKKIKRGVKCFARDADMLRLLKGYYVIEKQPRAMRALCRSAGYKRMSCLRWRVIRGLFNELDTPIEASISRGKEKDTRRRQLVETIVKIDFSEWYIGSLRRPQPAWVAKWQVQRGWRRSCTSQHRVTAIGSKGIALAHESSGSHPR
jgi:hypothetical protein